MRNEETAPSNPMPKLTEIKPGIAVLQPLSRRGHGPGLLLLNDAATGIGIVDGVPSPLMKWAEEGYTVVELSATAWQHERDPLSVAVTELERCATCQPKHRVGLVAYEPGLWAKVAPSLAVHPQIVAAVVYGDAESPLAASSIPVLQHLAGLKKDRTMKEADQHVHHYPDVESFMFATPFQDRFNSINEGLSHTRSLAFLKRLMDGPYFDLEAIWEEHTYFEFVDHSVTKTVSTMVHEPDINDIPTMTGGTGRNEVTQFYSDHFIHENPEDTKLELLSRTLGTDRVVDECIFKFTHDEQMDWLLPGIPPTGRKVELPVMCNIHLRGDRLSDEHILWDQASLLWQLGLLPEYLTYPYPLPDGRTPSAGQKAEYRVPAAGRETADKLRDKNAVPSNEMMKFGIRVSK